MDKRLYKSKSNRKVFGVCGGIGEYLRTDPTVIRLGFVLLFCCFGSGLLAYLLCAIIMPDEPSGF